MESQLATHRMRHNSDFFVVLVIRLFYEELEVPHKGAIVDSWVSEIVRGSKQVFSNLVPFAFKIGHDGLEIDRGTHMEARVDVHEGFGRPPLFGVDMHAFFFFESDRLGVELTLHGFDPAIQGTVGQ